MADQQESRFGTSSDAFDQVAPHYDAESTYVELSVWFRTLTWERMSRIFAPGMHILELGCGTGEDAVWNARRGVRVTATDASPAMLEQTRQKAHEAGVAALVSTAHFDFNEPSTWTLDGPFDGLYSNYGALNCTDRYSELGHYLADRIRPGGYAGLCLIGRYCPIEILWHGSRLRFKAAFRRLPGRAVAHLEGRYFPVYYPLPGALTRAFGPAWARARLDAIGLFLPPSDLYAQVGAHARLARLLLRLERAFATRPLLNQLGDHYWLELRHSP